MAKRDSFLLRIDPKILAAIRAWSDDEMRSMNGQIEYLLRAAVKQAGRLPKDNEAPNPETDNSDVHDKEG